MSFQGDERLLSSLLECIRKSVHHEIPASNEFEAPPSAESVQLQNALYRRISVLEEYLEQQNLLIQTLENKVMELSQEANRLEDVNVQNELMKSDLTEKLNECNKDREHWQTKVSDNQQMDRQLRQLQEDQKQFSTIKTQLDQQIADLQTTITKERQQFHSKQTNWEREEKRLNTLVANLETGKSLDIENDERWKSKFLEMENNYKAAKVLTEKVEEEKQSLEEQFQDVQQKLATWKIKECQFQQEISKLQSHSNLIESEKSALQHSLNLQKQAYKDIEIWKTKQESQMKQQVEQAKRFMEERLSDWQKIEEQQNGIIHDLQNRLINEIREKKEYLNANQCLSETLTKIVKTSKSEEEVKRMSTEIQFLREELVTLKLSCENLKRANEDDTLSYRNQLNKMLDENCQLKAQLQQNLEIKFSNPKSFHQRTLETQLHDNDHLRRTVDKLAEELHNASERYQRHVERLELDIRQVNEQKNVMSAELQVLERTYNDMKALNSQQESKLQALRSHIVRWEQYGRRLEEYLLKVAHCFRRLANMVNVK